MRRLTLFAIAGTCVLSQAGCGPVLASLEPSAVKAERGQIVHVADGDTVLVALDHGRTVDVRLLAIDSPEKYATRFGSSVECGSLAASAFMQRFASRRVVLVRDSSQPNRDRYGRLLRYVEEPNGTDIGAVEVRRGLAMPYQFHPPARRLERYRALASTARAEGIGSWGSPCGGDFHSSVPGVQDGS
jgi:endonuclease YncB( thermonuclease family)